MGGTTKPYFGPIPERPPGPVVGDPSGWVNGLSYAVWQAGGYSDPVGCWPAIPTDYDGKVSVGLTGSANNGIYFVYKGSVKVNATTGGVPIPVTVIKGSALVQVQPQIDDLGPVGFSGNVNVSLETVSTDTSYPIYYGSLGVTSMSSSNWETPIVIHGSDQVTVTTLGTKP